MSISCFSCLFFLWEISCHEIPWFLVSHEKLRYVVRAERNLSKGGSKFFFFNPLYQFFQILLFSIKIPKFRGGLILRSSSVPPSLIRPKTFAFGHVILEHKVLVFKLQTYLRKSINKSTQFTWTKSRPRSVSWLWINIVFSVSIFQVTCLWCWRMKVC